ncbi:hypothetical protein K9N68_02490 [Kovacikia minuta CCNUW1]|uniref:hypothetical protein n=1 Tax=Kovacikia minuta TaxID=2931930 RepID=UPI001CC90991|nr:hypothetical protein [Kovacikia minuta]UBF26877.1 hypothetical protein K9N68_02490 [Kovacikia minuta CCNUW1]
MPKFNPNPDSSEPLSEEELLESLRSMNIDQWIDSLQRSDRSFYNLMALEVWSIAKTMDGLLPGFWNRFMANRQVALKQFIDQQKQPEDPSPNGDSPPVPDSEPDAEPGSGASTE